MNLRLRISDKTKNWSITTRTHKYDQKMTQNRQKNNTKNDQKLAKNDLKWIKNSKKFNKIDQIDKWLQKMTQKLDFHETLDKIP